MADLKISQLTGATTPLAGTEVVPLVQSGTTKKVAVSDLTAGREVAMAGANSTDNLKVAAGKGLAYDLNTAVFMTPEDNIQGARIAAGGSFKLLVGSGNEAINIDATTRDVKATLGNFVIGTAGKGVDFGSSVLWRTGAGTPEGSVTAAVGSLYTRTDGGANTTLYVKESGAGNTGWVAK